MFVSILDFLTNRFTALTQKKKKKQKKNTYESKIKFKVKSQTF